MCKVDDRSLVRRRQVVDLQLVVFCDGVDDGYRKISRKALITIFACVTECETAAVFTFHFFRGPYHFVEPTRSTVQCVPTVILRKRVLLPDQRELSVADSISIATDDRAKVRTIL